MVAKKVRDGHLLMQGGNAMSVVVIKALGSSILEYDKKL